MSDQIPEQRKTVVTDPDPTAAVEAALKLAIKNLDDKVTLQFHGIDTASVLAREQLKEKLEALSSGINDKFGANEKLVNQQAAANKDLVDQLAKANSVALQAALQTQKESAAKFESSVADLIKQLQVSFDTANKATNEKIDRLTSRLDLGQGGFTQGNDTRREDREVRRDETTSSTNLWGILIGIAGVLAAAVTAIVSLGQRH
jgi:hypothetical protein